MTSFSSSSVKNNDAPVYELSPVQSTSLLTAFWRDVETRQSQNPLIQDHIAQSLLNVLLPPQQKEDYETSLMLPYGVDCLALRTRAMDDWLIQSHVHTAANENKRGRQVVNLGAGMCCRPYRLDGLSRYYTNWWEVDYDLELLRIKRSVLRDAGHTLHIPNLVDVSMDLSCPNTSLAERLQANGFVLNDPETPTDWIAEGLMAYLKADGHTKLLQDTGALSAKGSRIALTIAEPALNDLFEHVCKVKLPYQELVPIHQILVKAQNAGWTVDKHIQPDDWSVIFPGRGENLPGYHLLFLIKE